MDSAVLQLRLGAPAEQGCQRSAFTLNAPSGPTTAKAALSEACAVFDAVMAVPVPRCHPPPLPGDKAQGSPSPCPRGGYPPTAGSHAGPRPPGQRPQERIPPGGRCLGGAIMVRDPLNGITHHLPMTQFFLVLVIYFTPSLIGFSKNKKNSGAIFALNFLLGWTVIGWIGAFIWSLTNS